MAQTAVRVLFSTRHDDLERQLNAWFTEVSDQVLVTGVSIDSNDHGHCLTVLYRTGQGGRLYRGHIFYHTSHNSLELEANEGLVSAQAQWGKFVAIGSNNYGHCLCIVEEQ